MQDPRITRRKPSQHSQEGDILNESKTSTGDIHIEF